jgi:L-ribulose-5-phosphate 3-epimerase UlaE
MIYQPNALSYTDSTGRSYPGVIDSAQFTSNHLDQAIRYSYEKQVMAKFEVFDEKYNKVLATAYYNQEWYDRLEPVAFSLIPGIGGAKYYEKSLPVIYQSGGQQIPVTLKVTVIMPN